jgi:hypothetical protein
MRPFWTNSCADRSSAEISADLPVSITLPAPLFTLPIRAERCSAAACNSLERASSASTSLLRASKSASGFSASDLISAFLASICSMFAFLISSIVMIFLLFK